MTFEQKLCYKQTYNDKLVREYQSRGITSDQGDGACVGLCRNFMGDDSWKGSIQIKERV